MAQITHVLDTSALLAHAFKEPGWERVKEIIQDERAVLGLSAAVLFELHLRLHERGVLIQQRTRVAPVHQRQGAFPLKAYQVGSWT